MLAIIFLELKITMNQDKQSQFPINFYGSNQSDRMSSLFGLKNHCQGSEILGRSLERDHSQISQDFSVSPEEAKQYYNLLFSPHTTMQSLNKRNQNLEMKLLQQSDSEPEEIYFKRKERVKKLQEKEEVQIHILEEIQMKQPEKHLVISQFMKLFASIKKAIKGIRSDYYSNKVFITLQKTPVSDLRRITKTLFQMYDSIMHQRLHDEGMIRQGNNGEKVDERLIEFLIIPRFLISKDKLLKIADDEQMQNNFKFLISNGCLGHYNNQSNKKLPSENHLKYIRDLVSQVEGREKYKRLCSINHGGKFIRENGEETLYSIYFKPLDCLRMIDLKLKKKKKFSQLKPQVQKWINQFKEVPQKLQIPQNLLPVYQFDLIDARSVSKFLFSGKEKSYMDQLGFTKACSSLQIDDDRSKKSSIKVKKSISLLPMQIPHPPSAGRLKRFLTVESNIILVPTPDEKVRLQDI